MLTNRFVKSAGMAFAALFLAAAPIASGELLAGAGDAAGATQRITADHGWGKNAATSGEGSADGLLVLAGETGDHGWG
ncbi:hypothetical protein ACF065_03340 [Streptomyces sp. NPDC015232]|uniref:hypothetical protein n=1 Tax=unclassified Streptomyces TaxID=2593676 RepID=UPI0037012B00